MMLGSQFTPPRGRAIDPSSGKEANHRGYAESGDPVYRVPGSSREDMWVQTHPDRTKTNVPFAGATFRNTSHG